MLEARPPASRDIPGRKRHYETVYILRPDIPDDAVVAINAKIRKIIEENQGIILKLENWGKRRMAYMVKKQRKGTYLFWSYLGGAGLVEEIERNLKLSDPVIRFYTIKQAENVDPKAHEASFNDEVFSAAGTGGVEEVEPVESHDDRREDYDGDNVVLNDIPGTDRGEDN
ncbi:MAG: 30S ribosomal protein S6 [Deltaproteobacteria bacterium]|nr:30S ribosomal protein S6 [Deltaproteobacteria bacterium]